MESNNREHIVKNMDRLIACTEYQPLMDKCVERQLLSTEMRKNIERDTNLYNEKEADKEKEKHKNLFRKITKRGPTAYQKLKEILLELGNLKAERILSGDRDAKFISLSNKQDPVNNNPSYDTNRRLPAINTTQRFNVVTNNNGNDQQDSQSNGKFYVIKAKSLKDDYKHDYKMVSKKRGVLFMVNIINFECQVEMRKGAHNDDKALNDVFTQLHFKIYNYKDLRKDDFVNKLTEVLSSSECHDSECFVFILMSHGRLDKSNTEQVQFYDQVMNLQDIFKLFNDDDNKYLPEKPKVLLLPFCRGPLYEKKNVSNGTESAVTGGFGSGLKENSVVCFASLPGYQAHRDVDGGNWYIQDFCKVVSERAHDTHLEDMIKEVQVKVNKKETESGNKQTCSFLNQSFNKHLYFNPGLYKDEQGTTREFEEITDNRDISHEINETVTININNKNELQTHKNDANNKKNKVKTDYV